MYIVGKNGFKSPMYYFNMVFVCEKSRQPFFHSSSISSKTATTFHFLEILFPFFSMYLGFLVFR